MDESPGALALDIAIGKEMAGQIIKTDVTAVFCYCDTVAAGVIESFRKSGVIVPDDLSIIGFDNNTISEIVQPALTTIHQPKQEIGEIAMQMLLNCLSGGVVEDMLLDPYLVISDSTSAPKTMLSISVDFNVGEEDDPKTIKCRCNRRRNDRKSTRRAPGF